MSIVSGTRLSPKTARMAVTQDCHVRRRAHLGWIAVAALFSLAVAFGSPSQAQAQVTVTVTSSPNPSVYGNAVTFTATVTPSTTTGSVTFSDSGSTAGWCVNVPISNGTATCLKSNLLGGGHGQIKARYNGVPAVDSPFYSQLVYRSLSSTSLAPNINPSEFGQNVLLTAQVTPVPVTPPARMQFYSDGGQIVTASVSTLTGIATANVGNLTPPGHTMTAVYPGDNNLEPSTSPGYFQTVNKGRTATCVAAPSPNPVACGQLVTLRATVAPILPSGQAEGTVQFIVNGSSNGVPSAELVAGVATAEYSTVLAGTLTTDAIYQGNAVYLGSSASTSTGCTTQMLTVNKGSTVTAVTADINPSFWGQSVRFTATVSPSQVGEGGGSVTFRREIPPNPPVIIGTRSIPLSGVVSIDAPSSGVVALSPGCGNITASYSGNTCFLASASANYSHCVNCSPTSLTMASNINPSIWGNTVKLTATIFPINTVGRVGFRDITDPANPIPLASDAVINTLTGLASSNVDRQLLPINRVLQAYYPAGGADPRFCASVSPPYNQTVERRPLDGLELQSNANPSLLGDAVDLFVTVDPLEAYFGATVEFKEGGVSLGTDPVSGEGGVALKSVPSPDHLDPFTLGSHLIKAYYSGNTFYAPYTSATYTQDVTTELAMRGRLAGLVTRLETAPVEQGVRVTWVVADPSALSKLQLERGPTEMGPWTALNAEFRNDAGVTAAEDRTTQPGQQYFYRVVGTTSSGNRSIFGPVEGTAGAAPREFALSGAWPNPSRGALTMAISLPKASQARVSVLDLQGREVAVLADGGFPAGRHEVRWDGRTGSGQAAAGLYFIRLITPDKKFVSRVAIAH